MDWFNYYGLIIIAVIMIPNILSAILDKSSFENNACSKAFLVIEQIGRYCCMASMVFNIPFTYFGFWFDSALAVYLAANGALLLIYISGWIIFCKSRCTAKMLWLSITPTVLFMFSGVVVSSIPLLVSAVLFGVGHITVSYQNRT